MAPLFTVFTPTFDRKATLPRVYDSLRAQTCRDFEWVIVDDGSTDGTEALVARWKAETDFPITYVWQENRGKHVAFNRGVSLASGEVFLPLDSDDACVPEALERFKQHWDAVRDDPTFSAVTVLACDPTGALVGDRFPSDPTDSDFLELFYRHKVRGEKWGFHRVSVLRDHPFVERQDWTFVPEGTVWARIARRYKTRYVNEALRIYYPGPDQLTGSHPVRHAGALAYWHQSVLNDQIDYLTAAPVQFLKSALNYARFSIHQRVSLGRQLAGLTTNLTRALWTLALPTAALFVLRDRHRAAAR